MDELFHASINFVLLSCGVCVCVWVCPLYIIIIIIIFSLQQINVPWSFEMIGRTLTLPHPTNFFMIHLYREYFVLSYL